MKSKATILKDIASSFRYIGDNGALHTLLLTL